MPRAMDPEGAHARAVRSLVDLRGLDVLEVGCGEGRLTFLLAGEARTWFATDPNEGYVATARSSLPAALADGVRFAVAGGAEIEGDAAEYDLVFFSWSL